MNNLLQRPALGQLASIGTFFNEKTDTFLLQSLLQQESPSDVITRAPVQKTTIRVTYVDLYEQKFDMLGVGTDLGGSILAGLVTPGGAGRYIDEAQDSTNELHAAVHHKIESYEQKLNFMCGDVKDCLTTTAIDNPDVTHVVTGIVWGAQSVITMRRPLPNDCTRKSIEARFRHEVEDFKKVLEEAPVSENGQTKVKLTSNLQSEVTAYGDILLNDGISMANLQEGYNFLEMIPIQVKNVNGGLGYPIAYTLLPVSMLELFLPVQIPPRPSVGAVSPDCLKKIIQLFDSFRRCRQALHTYQTYALRQTRFLPPEHLTTVSGNSRALKASEDELKRRFSQALREVRSLREDPDVLWQLHREFSSGNEAPTRCSTIAETYREKMSFIRSMTNQGALYIGYNGLSVQAELSRRGALESYIFRFSQSAMKDQAMWNANCTLLADLLQQRRKSTLVAIVDCDAENVTLEKAQIVHYHNGEQVSNDVLEQQKFFADKYLARYQEGKLDTKDHKRPLKRRFVKIGCPGRDCNRNVLCDWLCFKCLAPIEYGYSDDYIYCDCGRTSYQNFDFKCRGDHHGQGYDTYSPKDLYTLLRGLKQSNYLNILILGETGVGKSTFINAFVNYLTFETLDFAMKEEDLTWVIPCSFDAMTMDRTKPESKIQRTKIKVGDRKDEADGSRGASATQQTTVYPVTIGTTTVRLIDTPGIGDTRGLEFDRKNMSDIIETLGSYDDLHGVLILLKSNSARLTPSFSFCIKELLRNLHRDAARNMAFGFTNTRISNYTPGDTLGPLEQLLDEHPDVGLSTSTNAMYCFDSESFRYLAAYKNNFVMPNEEDFRRSWTHSKEEAFRLLNHFQSRQPHMIKSTTSLHGTREVISMLTYPMTDMSKTIRANISLCEDQVQELKDTRLKGDALRQRLQIEKISLSLKPLGHHRTVCRDDACFEVRQNDDGDGFFIYSEPCHDHCWLDEIKADTLQQPGLINCTAFGGHQDCQRCGHPWQLHMHVIMETVETKEIVNDSGVEKLLDDHQDIIEAKQAAIEDLRQLVLEYKDEHDQIQRAAARFADFLQREAIVVVNDKTQAYIEHLINEEDAKIGAGKRDTRARDALVEDLKMYQEEVAILKRNVGSSAKFPPMTPADIDRLVRHLYGLKHFGKNLEALKKQNVRIHEAQNREISHRVRSHGSSWGWNSVQNIWGAVGKPSYAVAPAQVVVQKRYTLTKPLPPARSQPPVYNPRYQTFGMSGSEDFYDPYSQQYKSHNQQSLQIGYSEGSGGGSSVDSSAYPLPSRKASYSSRNSIVLSFPSFTYGWKRWGKKK
jgi:GTPase SAR1 family protein